MVTANPFTTANYVEAVDVLNKTIKEQADEIERLREKRMRLRETLEAIAATLAIMLPEDKLNTVKTLEFIDAALKEGE